MRLQLIALAAIAGLAVPPPAVAASRPRSSSTKRSFAINLRKRLNVTPLIADPGTMEVDFSYLLTNQISESAFPTTFRITPEGKSILWGRTEYSVNFDAAEHFTTSDGSYNHFTDHLNLAATSVILDTQHFDMAVGPETTILTRGDPGARLGGFAIARADWGLNSLGFSGNWTGATASSVTNPAATLDLGMGLARRLGAKGLAHHLTAHSNYQWERSTGATGFHSIFEGIEIEFNDNIALDLTGQHVGISTGNPVDHQFLASLAIGLGRYRHRHDPPMP